MMRHNPTPSAIPRATRWLITALILLLSGVAAPLHAQSDGSGRVRVRSIQLEGLDGFSRAERRALFSVAEGDSVSHDQLSAQRDTVQVRLARRGDRPFARLVAFTVDTLGQGRSVTLKVRVDPGPQPVVDAIVIEGPGRQWEDELRSVFATRAGDSFTVARWKADLARAADRLGEEGFPFATARTAALIPSFVGDTVRIEARMDVVPGARVELAGIEFAGLERTRPATARRIARMPAGRYHPATVDQARRRLLRTEWFRDVGPGDVYRDRDGGYGLLFRVEEQPASSVAGAVGYAGEEDGLAGSLDATLNNLFGAGRSVALHWRRDRAESRAFEVSYREPFLWGGPLGLTLHLDQEVRDSLYVAVDIGGSLDLRPGDAWTVTGSLRRRAITADSLATTGGSDGDPTDYTLFGAGASLAWDSRDRPSNPGEGVYAKLGSERLIVDGSTVPGTGVNPDDVVDTDLTRTSLASELTVPLQGTWRLFAALHGEDVRPDGGGRAPYAEWVELGGATTVRGYAERSLLAPTAGWATLELRRLLGPRSRAFALVDLAVLNRPDDREWVGGAGAGVQLDTGIGLLTVAVAVPSGEGFSAAVVHARAEARF